MPRDPLAWLPLLLYRFHRTAWGKVLNALRSLVLMANGTRFEVIVADEAFTDATQQLGRQLPWLRLWRSERNQGFLHNCNEAAALARDVLLLLLLNNDVLVGDHALPHRASRARSDHRHRAGWVDQRRP